MELFIPGEDLGALQAAVSIWSWPDVLQLIKAIWIYALVVVAETTNRCRLKNHSEIVELLERIEIEWQAARCCRHFSPLVAIATKAAIDPPNPTPARKKVESIHLEDSTHEKNRNAPPCSIVFTNMVHFSVDTSQSLRRLL